MPTYLALCEQLRSDVGVAGSIVTTEGLTGEHKKLAGFIQKANRKVQRSKANWKFLWAEWSKTVDAAELAPPSGLGMFDQTSFMLDAGTEKFRPLRYIDYKDWRDTYRNTFISTGDPLLVTIKPNGKVALLPPPETLLVPSVLTADYWRSPVELINNGQISLIPEQFHSIITAKAKIYYAEYSHNSGLFASANIEYTDLWRELKAHSLPGNEDDGKSQSSISHVIEVF